MEQHEKLCKLKKGGLGVRNKQAGTQLLLLAVAATI